MYLGVSCFTLVDKLFVGRCFSQSSNPIERPCRTWKRFNPEKGQSKFQSYNDPLQKVQTVGSTNSSKSVLICFFFWPYFLFSDF